LSRCRSGSWCRRWFAKPKPKPTRQALPRQAEPSHTEPRLASRRATPSSPFIRPVATRLLRGARVPRSASVTASKTGACTIWDFALVVNLPCEVHAERNATFLRALMPQAWSWSPIDPCPTGAIASLSGDDRLRSGIGTGQIKAQRDCCAFQREISPGVRSRRVGSR
jgi:hypothetical protein